MLSVRDENSPAVYGEKGESEVGEKEGGNERRKERGMGIGREGRGKDLREGGRSCFW